MSVISGEYINFVSAEEIFGEVRRFLKSFSGTNIIDEGEFPVYANEVLSKLGNGALKESEMLLYVDNYKTELPSDFVSLYAAYKCTPSFSPITSDKGILQNQSVLYHDITREVILTDRDCLTDCCASARVLERYNIKQYYNEGGLTMNVNDPVLLRVSPNVKERCAKDCLSLLTTSPLEISFSGRNILTNFTDDSIYLKYYGRPTDHNNVPLIKDEQNLKEAVKWYIIYMVTLSMWMNSEAPDIQSKWQVAEQKYNDAMGAAKLEAKIPSFNRMINYIRNARRINKVSAFSQNDRVR
jgi:hypothetical protein